MENSRMLANHQHRLILRYQISNRDLSDSPPTLSVGFKACGLNEGRRKIPRGSSSNKLIVHVLLIYLFINIASYHIIADLVLTWRLSIVERHVCNLNSCSDVVPSQTYMERNKYS
jgi:hypothetical protein